MKYTILTVALLVTGCATHHIVPAGKDTYMINRGGWPHMSGFAVESQCYRDANQFCIQRGLVMVPVSTTTVDGKLFCNNASSQIIFKAVAATNAP